MIHYMASLIFRQKSVHHIKLKLTKQTGHPLGRMARSVWG